MDKKSALAVAVFVVLTTFVASYHEPWRDEADAWLVARDASLGEMLHLAGYAGTPALWYVVEAPFAKAGAPYSAQRYLHLLLAGAAVGILICRAPFPFVVRLALAFGYFLSFEYAVVARNYSSGILLCFAVLALDRQRLRLAPLYGLAIGLAANASAHFTVFATALLLAFVGDALQPETDRRVWIGVALGLGGIGLAVWQLWPPVDGQLPPGLFTRFEPFRIRDALSQAFAPRAREGEWTLVLGVLVTGLVIARLWSARRAAFVFGLSCAGLAYVFVFKYASGLHHYGLFFIAVVIALWMAEGAPPDPADRKALLSRRAFSALLLVALLPSVYIATRVWVREVRYAFSEAEDMARFIQASRLDQARIAVHPPMASVLAFLPRRSVWYPGIGAEGSHMRWDARYRAALDTTVSEAVDLLKAQCPNWQDRRDPVLFLANAPLPDPGPTGYGLVYSTPGRPWLVEDEVFYLYAPTTVRLDEVKPSHARQPTCRPPAASLPTSTNTGAWQQKGRTLSTGIR
jgi:hypothetical protein